MCIETCMFLQFSFFMLACILELFLHQTAKDYLIFNHDISVTALAYYSLFNHDLIGASSRVLIVLLVLKITITNLECQYQC